MILTDNETKVDLLNNEAIAQTIVKLLRQRPDHPITIGVHGDWGAGKSSVLEMIETALQPIDGVLCLKVNGWRFQGFEDAKIALIESIVTGLTENEKKPLEKKALGAVKELYRRIDWMKIAKKAGGLALTAATGVPVTLIEELVDKVGEMVANPQALLDPEKLKDSVSGVKEYLKEEGESKKIPKEIEAFRKAFDKLLDEAGIKQLVVLIDDLDRCLPNTAIETLEAVKLFLFTPRTAFVVAADEAMIEYAVRKHFPDLPDTSGPRTYASNYLEKLIQVPFRIPSLGETETLIYVTLLLVGAELGENDESFNKLIAVARETLRKPWESGTIDQETVRKAIGQKIDSVQPVLTLSAQIGPILASGTKGNPRQIKRFLNSLLLRQSSAEARGFGNDVKLPVLAKLMLAERFIPRLFDQIASTAASSPNGVCKVLGILEGAVTQRTESLHQPIDPPDELSNSSREANKEESIGMEPSETSLINEWMSSQTIKSWARVAPSIGTSDLRPYLFVAKERKDYFGASSALGHLTDVVERLFGPKFLIATMQEELTKLTISEATKVFDAVRRRIISEDTFDREPNGAAGLTGLVIAHHTLQNNLLEFLENLPVKKLGPWVCNGWDSAIKDPGMKQRFETLLKRWSQEGSQILKGTANAMLNMGRPRVGR